MTARSRVEAGRRVESRRGAGGGSGDESQARQNRGRWRGEKKSTARQVGARVAASACTARRSSSEGVQYNNQEQ